MSDSPAEIAANAMPKADHAPTWTCRVNGPVESRDEHAIRAAIARGDDPLDFEVRGDAFLMQDGSYSVLDVDLAYQLAAAVLRAHAALAIQRRPEHIPLPGLGLVDAIVGPGGLALRGIETQVFPGFLDIGVSDADLESTPASRSVIFDRITGGWHTD